MLSILIAALATPIADEPVRRITVDGAAVEYRVTEIDGVRILKGQRLSDGKTFRFEVRGNGRIVGTVGDRRVRFADPR